MLVSFMEMPKGYRFFPTDGELISHCLVNKLLDREEPIHKNIIKEIDVYSYDPHQLPLCESEWTNEKEEYYLTITEPVVLRSSGSGSGSGSGSTTNTNTIRPTQHGYWKQYGDDEIVIHKQQIVGFKKTFVFYMENSQNEDQTKWILSECRLLPSGLPQGTSDSSLLDKMQRIAVCRLRKRKFFKDDSSIAEEYEDEEYEPKMSWHSSQMK
ncbi:NAC transcription factor 29-like [Senna tora]|uniref:NAC transcription factor 29-like n=1 Tax=Senna tora TaxID=362788 RepID=A0A835CAN2_9FABA|nr:NAC transcription factor 29-like [Senna tora]